MVLFDGTSRALIVCSRVASLMVVLRGCASPPAMRSRDIRVQTKDVTIHISESESAVNPPDMSTASTRGPQNYFTENVPSRVQSRGRAAAASMAAAASSPAVTHDHDDLDLETFRTSTPVFPETSTQYGRVRYYILWRGVRHEHLEGIWLCTWSHVSSHLPMPTLSQCQGINCEVRDDLGDAIDLWRSRRRTSSMPPRMA